MTRKRRAVPLQQLSLLFRVMQLEHWSATVTSLLTLWLNLTSSSYIVTWVMTVTCVHRSTVRRSRGHWLSLVRHIQTFRAVSCQSSPHVTHSKFTWIVVSTVDACRAPCSS